MLSRKLNPPNPRAEIRIAMPDLARDVCCPSTREVATFVKVKARRTPAA